MSSSSPNAISHFGPGRTRIGVLLEGFEAAIELPLLLIGKVERFWAVGDAIPYRFDDTNAFSNRKT